MNYSFIFFPTIFQQNLRSKYRPRGQLSKVLPVEVPPQDPTRTLLHTISDRIGAFPFVHLPLKTPTRTHTY